MNKRNILLAIVFAIIAPLSLQAQFARLDKYPQIPSHYDATFVDYVKDFASGVAKTSYAQYFGQSTRVKNIYGVGAYYNDKDGDI